LNLIKKAFQVLRCLFPSKLPIGAAQFDTWAKSIFTTYNLEDKPGNRHALASLIMHLGPVTAYKPKKYFSHAIMKSLANEIAFETIQALRKDEEAYIKKHMEQPAHPVPENPADQIDSVLCSNEQALA
jgi:hypothetical protein